MENSRKPPSAKPSWEIGKSPVKVGDLQEDAARELEQGVLAFLRRHALVGARLCLGLSGGIDSMVLLEIVSRLRSHLAEPPLAMHVHHGISAHADHWVRFCRAACEARGIPLSVQAVRAERRGGESWEEQARLRRYAAFERAGADAILLAHHLDDQCETFFLRLFRGSGVAGLGGMACERRLERHSSTRVLRPLLSVTRERILAYARLRSLSWIEDDSNKDPRFARNFLRREVLPLIESKFPAYRATLERALESLQDAGALVRSRARADLECVRQDQFLMVERLREIGDERALAVLRLHLEDHGCLAPPRARMEEVLRQAFFAREDARVAVNLGEGSYRRYRGGIFWVPAAQNVRGEIAWDGGAHLVLPGGELRFNALRSEGLSRSKLIMAPCAVRFRRGGERMQMAPNRPSRSLKNLLQEQAIAPWERDSLPLFYCGEHLAWMARVGYDCRLLAEHGEPSVVIQWIPTSSETASAG